MAIAETQPYYTVYTIYTYYIADTIVFHVLSKAAYGNHSLLSQLMAPFC